MFIYAKPGLIGDNFAESFLMTKLPKISFHLVKNIAKDNLKEWIFQLSELPKESVSKVQMKIFCRKTSQFVNTALQALLLCHWCERESNVKGPLMQSSLAHNGQEG